MAAVACNSSHRITHDVELSYTNINNANSHDDNLNDIRHDETNGDRTSDDLYC